MISPKMNRCTLVLVLVSTCAAVWGGEPNEPLVRLGFEIGSTALGPFSATHQMALPASLWRAFADAKPSHAAAIPIVGPIEFLPVVRRSGSDFLLFAEQRAGLSEQQKALLRAVKEWFRPGNSFVRDRPDPGGPERLWLYATTLEEAQKMAEAYYQYAMKGFHGQVDGLDRLIQKTTGNIAEEEKRISQIDKSVEVTQKSLDELQKTVPYRTEGEAHEAIGELDRMLNAAQVEIAGIKARMAAIQGYQQEMREGVPSVTNRLDMMFIEESIVLHGAEARRQMATHLREQANRFLDFKSTLVSAAGEKRALAESLEKNRANLTVMMAQLRATRENEPKIPEQVVIYPVKWIDDAPGN